LCYALTMKKYLRNALVFGLLFGSAAAQTPNISGSYNVTGSHESGTKYTGKATIRQTGQVYAMGWKLNDGSVYNGTGVLQGTHFAVTWTPCGVSLYTLRGSTLEGVWAGCGNTKMGKETLTKR
jgi:hypothetical protein